MRVTAELKPDPERLQFWSLLAVVQMPPGIPVATVAIGGARNAGILAAQILAASDAALAGRLKQKREAMAAAVSAKARKVEKSTR